MSYITQSNIEAVFGVDNIAAWSNLDNETAEVNAARVASAIEYAESFINDRFRGGRYAVPLTGNSSTALNVIKDIAAKLAGMWLFESRGNEAGEAISDRMSVHEERARSTIDGYLSGRMKLDCAGAGTGPTAPVVIGAGSGRSPWGCCHGD